MTRLIRGTKGGMQTQDPEFAQRIKTWGFRTLEFVNKISILFPGNSQAEGVYEDLILCVPLGTGSERW